MSAHTVYDCASLGSVIRYFDGTARPPARFRKKLSAWESRNGAGRLTIDDALMAEIRASRSCVSIVTSVALSETS